MIEPTMERGPGFDTIAQTMTAVVDLIGMLDTRMLTPPAVAE